MTFSISSMLKPNNIFHSSGLLPKAQQNKNDGNFQADCEVKKLEKMKTNYDNMTVQL